ncbi:MAG: hypothetical protein GYB31_04775 [Bacteroidetes bacterium]|nr:hypothetical protein [Bacteroidota bacterium]
MFPLNWTIVHPIDENSPMYGVDEQGLIDMKAEFIILIEGHDETYATTVHKNASYLASDIKWGKKFERMYEPGSDGRTILHLNRINAYKDASEEE